MKQKFLNLSMIISILCIIFSIVCFNICIFNNVLGTLIALLIAGFTYLIVNYIYNNVFKKFNSIYKKNNIPIIIFIIIEIILFTIIQISNLNIENIILFLLELLSYMMIYYYISKEYKKSEAVLSLLFMSIFSIFINMNLSTNIIILLFSSALVGYIIKNIDYPAINRKKNYICMAIIGIVIGIDIYISPMSSLYLLFVMSQIMNKKNKKVSLKFGLMSLVFICITLLATINLKIDVENDVYMIKNSLYSSYYFNLIFLVLLISSLYLLIKNQNRSKIINIIITIIGMALSILINEHQILLISMMYMLIYIDTISFMYKSIPRLYNKKIKTYKVKNSQKIDSDKQITAVIPNYNYEDYICERIDSVLYQTYKISELIVLDDVSKDNSIEVIEEKLKQVKIEYPELKIKFIKNKNNSGNVFKQWAKCFEVSNSDYLWICEADDSASPYFLENVMKGFDDEDVVISYAESLTMDENDNLLMPDLREWIDIYETGKWNKSYIISGKEELTTTMCINNTLANVSSAVFKKKKNIDYRKYLKVAEEFKLAGDWYFYVKVLGHGKIAYCKKSLNYHRMHSKSVTLTTKNDLHYKEICRIQDMIMKDYKLSNDVKKLVFDRRENTRLMFSLGKEELRLLDIPFEKILRDSKIKESILLSIIIPVYNTEQYLRKCLDSVLLNLPPKTEILIINDGSPDNAKDIGKEYEQRYPTIIKQYIKKNGGLSSAKNYGLERAKGRYIIYLDSDDYVSNNMYITMLKKGLETDADIVYSDIFEVFEDNTKRFVSMTNYSRKNKYMQLVDTPMMAASWNKIIKKSLYKDLKYPEGKNNEDVAITPILFDRAKIIEKVASPFYNYLQRKGSIQNSGFNEKRFVIFETSKICIEYLKNSKSKNIEEVKGAIYTHQLFGLLLFAIMKLKKKERLKYIKVFCNKMNEFDDYYTNKYVIEYMKKYNIEKLLNYVKNNSYNKINRYLIFKFI